MLLPLLIACSPVKAFRRQCRLENAVTSSPLSILPWFLAWFFALSLAAIGIDYTLDVLRGVRSIFGYSGAGVGQRSGSPVMIPVHLPIAWLQCLSVSVVAMALAGRTLSARKLARLATWLLPFTLVGGVFAVVYEHVWQLVILPLLFFPPYEFLVAVRNAASALVYKGPDLMLGLFAGLAAGTVVRRRRWLIVSVTTIGLVAGFPVYRNVQLSYLVSVSNPICEFMFGPPPRPPTAILLAGPTFAVGTAEPVLAGRWVLEYEDPSNQDRGEMTFDRNGRLVRYETHEESVGEAVELIADGQTHDVEMKQLEDRKVQASYRVLSGANRSEYGLVLHVRVETDAARESGDITVITPIVTEEIFMGTLEKDGTRFSGTSNYMVESPGVTFDPPVRVRPFTMTRVPAANPEEEDFVEP
ncbi:MAG: hypothetical protein ACYTFA_06280 [Planctomycetota bacterium]|jgi:hypothetical protein